MEETVEEMDTSHNSSMPANQPSEAALPQVDGQPPNNSAPGETALGEQVDEDGDIHCDLAPDSDDEPHGNNDDPVSVKITICSAIDQKQTALIFPALRDLVKHFTGATAETEYYTGDSLGGHSICYCFAQKDKDAVMQRVASLPTDPLQAPTVQSTQANTTLGKSVSLVLTRVTAATISASLRLSPGERTLYLDIFGYGRLDGVQYNVPAQIKLVISQLNKTVNVRFKEKGVYCHPHTEHLYSSDGVGGTSASIIGTRFYLVAHEDVAGDLNGIKRCVATYTHHTTAYRKNTTP